MSVQLHYPKGSYGTETSLRIGLTRKVKGFHRILPDVMVRTGQQYGVRNSGGCLRSAPDQPQAILRPFQTLREPLAKRLEHESGGHVVSGFLK